MLLSAASQETQKADEPVVWVLVRSRPYFVRVRHLEGATKTCYLNGDWVWAREYLVWCYGQNPADRPAVVLLEYMAAKRFAAPKGWLGCRRDDYEDDPGGELRV